MSNLPVQKQIIIDGLIFVVVFVPLLVLHTLGKPVPTGFWCRDESLSYPYKPDTVPQSLLLVVSFGGPFFVMAVCESIRAAVKTSARPARKLRTELMSLAKAYSVFLFGIAANCIFTETLKLSVGRLRPHFFDLCRPNFDQINCTADVGQDRYVMEYECTNTDVDQKLLRDSHLSFPSGHASVSVFSALFTIFYLQMRMKVNFSHLLRPALQMCILIMAVLCCITRVTDYKHFTSDVVVGIFIGASLAWLSFYKLGQRLIPSLPTEKPPRLRHATSVESEPQTPTPLLRPERLVINHAYRNGSTPATKEDFVHKV